MVGTSDNGHSLRKSPEGPPHLWDAQVTLTAEMREDTTASLPEERSHGLLQVHMAWKIILPKLLKYWREGQREVKYICLRLSSQHW